MSREIVLLKIKCPFTRVSTRKISKYYKPQILLGLCFLSLMSRGMFVNCRFRKCSYQQLGFSAEYDREYHTSMSKKKANLALVNPIVWNVLALYVDQNSTDRVTNFFHNTSQYVYLSGHSKKIYDVKSFKSKDFSLLFWNIDKKFIHAINLPITTPSPAIHSKKDFDLSKLKHILHRYQPADHKL